MTHPTILASPLSNDEAMSNIEALLAPSHVRVAGEGDGFWPSFRELAADVKPRGNLVPDVDHLEPRPGLPQVPGHHGEGPIAEEHSAGFE